MSTVRSAAIHCRARRNKLRHYQRRLAMPLLALSCAVIAGWTACAAAGEDEKEPVFVPPDDPDAPIPVSKPAAGPKKPAPQPSSQPPAEQKPKAEPKPAVVKPAEPKPVERKPAPEREEKIVREIEIRGLARLEKPAVLALLRTRVGERFDPKVWEMDGARLYETGHFTNVRTATPVALPNGVKLAIELIEKPAETAEKKPAPPEEKKPPETAAESKPAPVAAPEPKVEKKPASEVVVEPEKKPAPVEETAAPAKPEAPAQDTAAAAAPPAPAKTEAPPIALPENEAKLHSMVRDAAKTRPYFRNRMPQEIFSSQAVLKGIEKNLGIQRQALQEEVAKAALQEAKAVFDPFITISFNHSMQSQTNRTVKVSTYQEPTQKRVAAFDPNTGLPVRDGNGNVVFIDVLDQGPKAITKFPIKQLVFSNPRPGGFRIKRNVASVENPNGPVQSESPSFRVDQQLPWGPSVFFSFASKRSETFFDDGPDVAIDQQRNNLIAILADPNASAAEKAAAATRHEQLTAAFKKSIFHFQGSSRPWTTTVNAGGFIPVPMTKDWGEYSRADLGVKLADLDKTRAFWDTKAVINFTLRDIDHAYWDVVGALENLRASTENRKLLEGLQGKIKEQLDAGRTTVYGKLQIDAQLAGVRDLEESAWAAYIQTSNSLVTLLDMDENIVLLPGGYTKNLGEQLSLSLSDAHTIAMENRPDLKAQQIGGESSEVLLRFAKNQVKPDLKANANVSFSQTGQPFGFKTWSQSLQSLVGAGSASRHPVNVPVPGVTQPATVFQLRRINKREDTSGPDNRSFTLSAAYNWPYRNRAVKAALTEAVAERDKQDIRIGITENQVEQDVGDAVVGLMSAKTQYEIAVDNFKLAETSYKEASDLLAGGRMTEFEIISRSRELLFADLNRISASVQYKKAESQLLQAEGVLSNAYANARSQGMLEDLRLDALAAGNALKFFKPVALEPDPADKVEAAAPATAEETKTANAAPATDAGASASGK